MDNFQEAPKDKRPWYSKIPSIGWVIIIPAAIALFIGGIGAFFFGLSEIEGLASVIVLIAGYFTMRNTGNSFGNAMIIVFYALMGMAIDQPGNIVFNKPLEIWQCPSETSLDRGVVVSNPLPGRTDITQNFKCVDSAETIIKPIDNGNVMIVRFAEYTIAAYIFMGLRSVRAKFRKRKSADEDITPPRWDS